MFKSLSLTTEWKFSVAIESSTGVGLLSSISTSFKTGTYFLETGVTSSIPLFLLKGFYAGLFCAIFGATTAN